MGVHRGGRRWLRVSLAGGAADSLELAVGPVWHVGTLDQARQRGVSRASSGESSQYIDWR